MDRLALSLAAISLLAGCAGAPTAPRAPAGAALAATPAAASAPEADALAQAADDGRAPESRAPAASGRAAGDYVVHRFSGAFRKGPLTLTERVLSRDGATLTVAVTLDGAGQHEALEVRVSDAPETRGDVLSVARRTGEKAEDATLDDYEALLSEVTLAADENEALIGVEEGTLEIAGSPLPCKTTRYRVKVGGKKATMRTIESASFPWGDAGTEIIADGGRVLYRSEVVEAGRAQKTQEAIAASAYEE